ncbi:MAG TPA: hypothetical protein VGP72_04955 [Planctomycetota bacterium]|jgi:hypothetical protein
MLSKILNLLASLKLALVLLLVIITAAAVGTILESGFNADVAKNYIYGHWWFDLWLAMLCINLIAVAIDRYPWKSYQSGFVLTHFGIVILLIGGLIDRQYGVEGFMRLYRGRPGNDILELRDDDLFVRSPDGAEARTQVNPKAMLTPSSFRIPVASPDPSLRVEILDKFPPAAEIAFSTKRAGSQSYWLMLGDGFELGAVTVRLLPGLPPQPKAETPAGTEAGAAMLPRRERTFIFAKPELEAITRPQVGEATGVKAELRLPAPQNQPMLSFTLNEKFFSFPVTENVGKTLPLEGLKDWQLKIMGYYPHFRMDGAPTTVDDKPENPAAIFELIGPLVPADDAAEAADDPHGGHKSSGGNALTLYAGSDGKLRYFLKTRSKKERAGELDVGKPVEGWEKDSQFMVEQFVPSGLTERLRSQPDEMNGFPVKQLEERAAGLLCKLTSGNESRTVWLQEAEALRFLPESVSVGGKEYEVALPHRHIVLPFKVALEKFSAPHQEGRESAMDFMAFESTLSFQDKAAPGALQPPKQIDTVWLKPDSSALKQMDLTSKDGQPVAVEGAVTAWDESTITFDCPDRPPFLIPRGDIAGLQKQTQKISMNHPTSYPRTWYGPWVGNNYKFSQSGHDPNNPDYSGVQVLTDPGWLPKWLGSLMICAGIFVMYYLKPYMKGREKISKQEAGRRRQEQGGPDKVRVA